MASTVTSMAAVATVARPMVMVVVVPMAMPTAARTSLPLRPSTGHKAVPVSAATVRGIAIMLAPVGVRMFPIMFLFLVPVKI